MTRYAVLLTQIVLVTIVLSGFDSDTCAETRTWTSAKGKFSVRAELVDYTDEEVQLRKEDGKIIAVQLEKLGRKDQRFLSENLSNIYRVPGKFTIRNLVRDFTWKENPRQKQGDYEVVTITTGKDSLAKAGIMGTVIAVPLKDVVPNHMKEPLARNLANKAGAELSKGLSDGFEPTSSSFEVRQTPTGDSYVASNEFTEKTRRRGVIYQDIYVRLIGSHAVALSLVSNKANPSKKYSKVCESLENIGL